MPVWSLIISLWLAGSGPIHPYGTVRFTGPQFTSHEACRAFAKDFIKSETNARPAHRATYSCTFKEGHHG